MKKDLFKELGDAVERELLSQNELNELKGGINSPVLNVQLYCSSKNIYYYCPTNMTCEPDPNNSSVLCPKNTTIGSIGCTL